MKVFFIDSSKIDFFKEYFLYSFEPNIILLISKN